MPKAIGRFGAKPAMLAGGLLFGGGCLLYLLAGPATGYWGGFLPGLVVTAIGVLFGFIPSMVVATSGLAPHEQGLAAGLLATFQQVGAALGLAVVVAVTAMSGADPLTSMKWGMATAAAFGLLSAVAGCVVTNAKPAAGTGPVVMH